MERKTVGWLFAVIVLSCALITSIILGVTGYFFSVNFLHKNSDIVVGDSVTISVLPNESNVASFTLDGAFLPNETIPQVIQINAQDSSADVRVRVKAKSFGFTKEPEFQFVTTEHFEQAPDGYYYFDDILRGGNKITFCNYIIVPQNDEFSSDGKYILTFVVETLETKFDSQKIWGEN